MFLGCINEYHPLIGYECMSIGRTNENDISEGYKYMPICRTNKVNPLVGYECMSIDRTNEDDPLGRNFWKNKCMSVGRTYYNISMGCMQIFPLTVM